MSIVNHIIAVVDNNDTIHHHRDIVLSCYKGETLQNPKQQQLLQVLNALTSGLI